MILINHPKIGMYLNIIFSLNNFMNRRTITKFPYVLKAIHFAGIPESSQFGEKIQVYSLHSFFT